MVTLSLTLFWWWCCCMAIKWSHGGTDSDIRTIVWMALLRVVCITSKLGLTTTFGSISVTSATNSGDGRSDDDIPDLPLEPGPVESREIIDEYWPDAAAPCRRRLMASSDRRVPACWGDRMSLAVHTRDYVQDTARDKGTAIDWNGCPANRPDPIRFDFQSRGAVGPLAATSFS